MLLAAEARPDAGGTGARLAASPTVRFLSLGERAALFCERSQALHELNPAAALIWRGLAAGAAAGAVAHELQAAGAHPGDAVQFVQSAARAWLEAGFLTPADLAETLAAPGEVELHLRCGRYAARLAFHMAPDAPTPGEAAAVFRPFLAGPREGAAGLAVVAHAGRYVVAENGAPRGWLPEERVIPELKAALTEGLTRTAVDGAFLIHGALLARGSDGLLITGAPGAGKTTLTLALAAHGFGFASDDIVEVGADGAFAGIPFSPASKAGAWPLLEAWTPALRRVRAHLRADGQSVRYVPIRAAAPPARIRWILLLDRRPEGPARLEPVEPLAALTELLAGAISAERRMQAEALESFAAAVCRAEARRLIYSDLMDAVATVGELTRGPDA